MILPVMWIVELTLSEDESRGHMFKQSMILFFNSPDDFDVHPGLRSTAF